MCSEVSVNSLENPWSQSWRRKGRLRLEEFTEKGGFKLGMKEWGGDGWWEWCVDGTDGGSATHRTGWFEIGEISTLYLVDGEKPGVDSRDEGKRKTTGRNHLLFVEKMMCMDEQVWPKIMSECCEETELWWGYADMKVGCLWELCR